MKFILLIITLSLLPSPTTLQATKTATIQGVVVYDYYLDEGASKAALQKLKETKPETYAQFGENYRRSNQIQDDLKFTLRFNEQQSIFELDKRVEPTTSDRFDYDMAVIMASGARDFHYLDHEQKVRLSQGKIEGSSVNIIEAYPRHKWTLTGEKKIVDGRTLLEATTQRTVQTSNGSESTSTVQVWYAPDIPVSFGPQGYDGLPGLIMELRFGPKYVTGFTAIEIDINQQVTPKEIRKPKAVAEMTEGDFQRKMQELRLSRQR